MSLIPRRYSVADPAEAIELCFEKGWTDGLPVVPPTEERVGAMLEAARLRPGDPGAQRAPSGRAARLVMRNVCGSRPGALDRGTLGHPGKLSYVIAENEAESPWTPLHVERRFRPQQSALAGMAAGAGPPAPH